MALGKDHEKQDCPIARALEVVGERWTVLVLRDCFLGVRRFNDTCGVVPGAADIQVRPGPGADLALRDDRVTRALFHPHRLLEPVELTNAIAAPTPA